MRIVITGATSFVGLHLLPLLAGHEVVALKRGGKSDFRLLDGSQPANVRWVAANLSEGLDPAVLPETADALVHLAQSDRYREFPAGAADMFRVNVETPAKLMRWAQAAGVKRAVLASTGTVYEPFTGPMHESAAVSPTGYYGGSKLACEALTLPYQSEALSVAQLRLFFIYGPGQANSMLARVMANVASGEAVTLPAEGDGLVFSPTYVGDVARAIVEAMDEGWRGVWNVAGPEAVSLGAYIRAVAGATGREPLVTRTAQAAPAPIVPDLTRLWTRMDQASFVPLMEGVRRTLVG